MEFNNIDRLRRILNELLINSSDTEIPKSISCFISYSNNKYVSLVYSVIDDEIRVTIPENSEDIMSKIVKVLSNLAIKLEASNDARS